VFARYISLTGQSNHVKIKHTEKLRIFNIQCKMCDKYHITPHQLITCINSAERTHNEIHLKCCGKSILEKNALVEDFTRVHGFSQRFLQMQYGFIGNALIRNNRCITKILRSFYLHHENVRDNYWHLVKY